MDPFKVVRDFEQALCEYTGAPYAVAVTSCTMALLLACRYHYLYSEDTERSSTIIIPKHTYVSVPQAIKHAGFSVEYDDIYWQGSYQLKPYPIFDNARYLTSGLYRGIEKYNDNFLIERDCKGEMVCLSFHWSKHLAIGQGGAILHDNPEADKWFRKARFDGRTEGVAPKDDYFDMIGHHCYMSPRDAAEGLSRLAVLPKHNDPLPNDDYPDLSKFEIFQ